MQFEGTSKRFLTVYLAVRAPRKPCIEYASYGLGSSWHGLCI